MLAILGIAIALALLSRIPGFLPMAGIYAQSGWFYVLDVTIRAARAVRQILHWAIIGPLAWLALLFAAIYSGRSDVMLMVFLSSVVIFTLTMFALIIVTPMAHGLLNLAERLGRTIASWFPIHLQTNWWQTILVLPFYGFYLLIALPIRGAAEVLALVGGWRAPITAAMRSAVTVFAAGNVVMWLLTMLAVFQLQHGVVILTPVVGLVIIGAVLLLTALSYVQANNFAGPKVYLKVAAGLSLFLMGVVALTSVSPQTTREAALHLENVVKHSRTSSRTERVAGEITGSIFGHTASSSILLSCYNCVFDQNGNFVGQVGQRQDVPAGTYFRIAGDDDHPVELYGVQWVRVYKTLDDNPKLYNMDQVYLIYKDDLILEKRPSPNAHATMAPYYPRWFLAIAFLFAAGTLYSLIKKRWLLAALGIAVLIAISQKEKVSPVSGEVTGYGVTTAARAAVSVPAPTPEPKIHWIVWNETNRDILEVYKDTEDVPYAMVKPGDGWEEHSAPNTEWVFKNHRTSEEMLRFVGAPSETPYKITE